MLSCHVQHPPGVALPAWPNNLPHLQTVQIHHNNPARPNDVDIRGQVIARIDDKA